MERTKPTYRDARSTEPKVYFVLCFRSEPKEQAFEVDRYKNFPKLIFSKFILKPNLYLLVPSPCILILLSSSKELSFAFYQEIF
jgi:hypothetical protein